MPTPQGLHIKPEISCMQLDVWEGYTGLPADTLDMEIYQAWLEPATAEELAAQEVRPGFHCQ